MTNGDMEAENERLLLVKRMNENFAAILRKLDIEFTPLPNLDFKFRISICYQNYSRSVIWFASVTFIIGLRCCQPYFGP